MSSAEENTAGDGFLSADTAFRLCFESYALKEESRREKLQEMKSGGTMGSVQENARWIMTEKVRRIVRPQWRNE